jgi:AcrR family transcriptional regulator
MQRARLLGGAVAAVEELGWTNVTVASIASRARVSRKTFYDLFVDREDCLLEVCEDTVERVVSELRAAKVAELEWSERMRTGLWVILGFFDREPELARVCVVESAHGGPGARAWRSGVLQRLIVVVDEGRLQGAGAGEVPGLMAEGVVGAVLSILSRLLMVGEGESLIGSLDELASLVVLPYVGSKGARELRKRPLPQASPSSSSRARVYHAGEDPLKDVPMRLTYRTSLVLEQVAKNPGASNRLIGEHADIHDQGQISKLLARLQTLGLLTNTAGHDAHTKGAPNEWSLTPLGESITEHLALSTDPREDQA